MSTKINNFGIAPIVLFVYNRLDTLHQTITALLNNYLANQSELIVFSDGPKSFIDESSVSEVRNYIKSIKGFKNITIFEAPKNNGLARSIISGVTTVFENYDKLIVLEDDVLTSPNFLHFMNSSLSYYENDPKIFSISGWSIPIKRRGNDDVYFTKRSNSACWASWKNRWEIIDWEIKDYPEFLNNSKLQKQFNEMGSDMTSMLKRQMNGQLNSWAIRWCYHQFKTNQLTVYPILSKSINIGYDSTNATNTTEKFSRFKTDLDQNLKTEFNFPSKPMLDQIYLKQFLRPHRLTQRIKYKLLNKIFGKHGA